MFFSAVLVPNLRILTFSNSFYCFNIFFIVISVGFMILSIGIIDLVVSNSHYGHFSKTLLTPNFIFVLILLIGTTYHLDNIWVKFQGND